MHRSFPAVVALASSLAAVELASAAQGDSAKPAAAQAPQPLPSIAERTEKYQKLDGFLPLYWDGDAGTLYLEIARTGQELLYVSGLSAGLGSNDIGLDRAQLGAQKVVRFERVGRQILMVEPNYRYRAVSTDPAVRGAPNGHIVNIREVRLAAGAEFVVMICGDMMTMPGLPKVPSAEKIDVTDDGKVVGLF